MESLTNNVIEKLSSYKIFNNLFPGIIFCAITGKITRIKIATGSAWENLFIYYFVGMILSRVGSILIERILRSLKVNNKKTGTKDPYLKFAEYGDYIDAIRIHL